SSSIQLGDASSLGMGNLIFTHSGTGDTIQRSDPHNWSDFGFKDGQFIVISNAASGDNGTFQIHSGSTGKTLTLEQKNQVSNNTTAATIVIALDPGTKDPNNNDPVTGFAALKNVTHSLIKTSELPMTADGFNADGKQFYVKTNGSLNTFELHRKADLSDAAVTVVGFGASDHQIGPESVDLTGAGSGVQQLRVNLTSGPS